MHHISLWAYTMPGTPLLPRFLLSRTSSVCHTMKFIMSSSECASSLLQPEPETSTVWGRYEMLYKAAILLGHGQLMAHSCWFWPYWTQNWPLLFVTLCFFVSSTFMAPVQGRSCRPTLAGTLGVHSWLIGNGFDPNPLPKVRCFGHASKDPDMACLLARRPAAVPAGCCLPLRAAGAARACGQGGCMQKRHAGHAAL